MQHHQPHFIGSLYNDNDTFDIPSEQIHVANGTGLIGQAKQWLSLRLYNHNGVVFLKDKLKHLNPRLLQVHFGPEAINALPLALAMSLPMIIY